MIQGGDNSKEEADRLVQLTVPALRKLAKDYNLAYYIDNVDRMNKVTLLLAITEHMNWEKEQDAMENEVDFSADLADYGKRGRTWQSTKTYPDPKRHRLKTPVLRERKRGKTSSVATKKAFYDDTYKRLEDAIMSSKVQRLPGTPDTDDEEYVQDLTVPGEEVLAWDYRP